MTEPITNQEIDKIIQETKKDLSKAEEVIEKKKEESKISAPKPTNEGKKSIDLGELGNYECVTSADIDDVFDKLDGLVLKIKNCIFKISYINRGRKRFTAEVINEQKKTTASENFLAAPTEK